MNLEYSPMERFQKIVEILAEGTLKLIEKRAKVISQFIAEAIDFFHHKTTTAKPLSFSSSVTEFDTPADSTNPRQESCAKTQIRTIQIRHE